MVKRVGVIKPYYSNEDNTQIDCVVEMDTGTKQRMVINKFASDGITPNEDWQWLHDFVSQDELNKNTSDYRAELAAEKEREKAARERVLGEELFNLKLEIFEMDEIRQSKDTKMKSKIRRATNKTQAMLYAGALLNKSMDNEETKTEEKPKPKKAPTKKRAPAKKKAPGKVTIVDTINDDKRDK